MSMKSEIIICVRKENYEKILNDEKIRPLFKEDLDIYEEVEENIVVFGWECIKWNPELYSDEKALMEHLRSNKKEPYRFCKLDYDDYGYHTDSKEENYVDGSCARIYINKQIKID